jgi:hypothetical protein
MFKSQFYLFDILSFDQFGSGHILDLMNGEPWSNFLQNKSTLRDLNYRHIGYNERHEVARLLDRCIEREF